MTISTPYLISLIFTFLYGTCIGSFLNLVIYRVPLKLSIVTPRSQCPSCEKTIPPFALIPIFSFFFLLGRCYFCKTKISWRYPIIELFTGILTTILYLHYFNEVQFLNLLFFKEVHLTQIMPFITSLWLLYTGIVLSFIDFDYRILPDVITIPGMAIGFILSSLNSNVGYKQSLLGIVVGFGGLYFITKLYEIIRKREGMGFGDIKYLGFIGSCVGLLGTGYTIFIASVLGSIIGIIYGITTKKGLSASLPFGPFLSISALFVFVALPGIN